MSLPGPDISALEYVFPSHHHKDAISSLLIGLQKEGENFCVGPAREKWVKNKAHTSVLAHSTSQLAVCPPCTQFLIPPGDQHTVSAPGDIFCLFLCAGNCPVLGTTHPQLPSAARCFSPFLHRCKYADRGRLALTALTSTFPCRWASPLTWDSDFLLFVTPVTSCFWYSRAGREEETWHWARSAHPLCGGNQFSEGPWKVAPMSWIMRHCLTSREGHVWGTEDCSPWYCQG